MAYGVKASVLNVNASGKNKKHKVRTTVKRCPGGRSEHSRKGLTVVEILILLVILGGIVLTVLPTILSRLDEARAEATRNQLLELSQSLERYKVDNQLYPTTEQGLLALVKLPETPPVPSHWDPEGYYRGNLTTDAWGNPLIYESSSGRGEYQLTSLGSDGEIGGEGYAADILLRRKDSP